MCLGADPSHHMGINVSNGKWGCWRDPSHRGNRPHRLIISLIHCTFGEAKGLVGDIETKEAFDIGYITNLLYDPIRENNSDQTLNFPIDFIPIKNSGSTKKFYNYLRHKRGFGEHTDEVIEKHKLTCCLHGNWENRIIFPIYLKNKLVTWTGRTLGSDSTRYKTLSRNDSPPALERITDTIFNYDSISETGGETLVICEGPFDALKIDSLSFGARSRVPGSLDGIRGEPGTRATCLFGTGLYSKQKILLSSLDKAFGSIYILLDREMYGVAMRHASSLILLDVKVAMLPENIEDPGDMSPTEVANFILTL